MIKERKCKSSDAVRVCLIGTRHGKATQDKTRGLLRFAAETSDWEVFLSFNEPNVKNIHDTIKHWAPDAVILYSHLFIPVIEPLVETSVPIAAIDINVNGCAGCKIPEKRIDISVQIDDVAVSRRAADCLLRRGFSNFAYFGSRDGTNKEHSLFRGASFAARIGEKGRRCAVYPLQETPFSSWILEEPRIIAWLKRLSLPCGIMAYNDFRGKLLLDACRHAGLAVPEQVAVIGVDNDVEICESTRPRLSSVSPDFELAGYTTARLMDDKIRKKSDDRKHIVYDAAEVVERESTQEYSGGARLVSMADAYIRKKACNGLSVNDVATALCVSPRLLEMRFRSILEETVLSRIQRVKLEKVKHLLLKTSLQIKEIGPLCGFQNDIVLKALFKKKLGCSMRSFRESHGRIPSDNVQDTHS